MWRCTVCGFIYDGEEAPQTCPRCGSPKEKFERVELEKATLITRSRLSNYLHQKIYTLLEEVKEAAARGVSDDLDPTCVKIFKEAERRSHLLQQMIKAEIQGHINKGKWG